MPADPEELVWTPDDAVWARQMFASTQWAKMIQIMQVTGPQINSDSMEKAGISGLRKDTWDKCLNAFTKFGAAPEPEEEFDQADMSQFDSSPRPGAKPPPAKVETTLTVKSHGS